MNRALNSEKEHNAVFVYKNGKRKKEINRLSFTKQGI